MRSQRCKALHSGEALASFQTERDAAATSEYLWTAQTKIANAYHCRDCKKWHLEDSQGRAMLANDVALLEPETFEAPLTSRKCPWCTGSDGKAKTIFETKADARAAIEARPPKLYKPLRIYQCLHGHGLHLTSKPKAADAHYAEQALRQTLAQSVPSLSNPVLKAAPAKTDAPNHHPAASGDALAGAFLVPGAAKATTLRASIQDLRGDSSALTSTIQQRLLTLLAAEPGLTEGGWIHINDLDVIVNVFAMAFIHRSSYRRCGDHFTATFDGKEVAVDYKDVKWR